MSVVNRTAIALIVSTISVFANGESFARNDNHPAQSGMGGVAAGCQNGQATGNKHCTDHPVETHNEHIIVPSSNQIGGSGGTSKPPVVPPGYIQFPTWTGKRDPKTGFPVPPDPPAQKIPQPMEQKVPKPQPYNVPSMKPGYIQFPTWTGKRDPKTGFPVPPDPPAQKIPQPMEQKVPKPQPYNVPNKATQNNSFHPSAGKGKKPVGHKLITRYPGRQPLHNLPQFESENPNRSVRCALSGYQRRRFIDVFGKESEAGTLPSLRNGGSIVRDIPAWHEPAANCLIVIKKRKHRKKLRPR